MWHFPVKKETPSAAHPRATLFVSVSMILLIGILLAACGSPATQTTPKTTPIATLAVAPTPTATPQPTATPIPTPTPAPAPTQAPPPQPGPPPVGNATLDLTPASMSIVGHLDCTKIGSTFNCQARVLAPSSNRFTLHWAASVNFANNVTFSPASSNLPPGTSIIVNIFVPTNDCNHGLFIFRGPINTHTITWAC